MLLIHNYYKQPGGEDVVFEAERDLLARQGHTLLTYTRDNHMVGQKNRLELATTLFWSREAYGRIGKLAREERPEIAHYHNTHVLISPAGFYACRDAGVPVVQSLHNPRLLCPAASLYRAGQHCQACLGKAFAWPAVVHRCYRHSVLQTGVIALMQSTHRLLGTWSQLVDRYVVFTEFYRHKLIEGGLPADRITVKPHFVYPDPGPREGSPGDYALFIGRLDEEKGVRTLLQAWRLLKHIPLKIRGSGDLLPDIETSIQKHRLRHIEIVGRLSRDDLFKLIKGAKVLIWPSLGYYESFGLVAIEAFACGVPVIASKIGVMKEIIEHGQTGLHFEAGNPQALAHCVARAWEAPGLLLDMGIAARQEYEHKYTARRNYEMLMSLYRSVLGGYTGTPTT